MEIFVVVFCVMMVLQ